MKINIKKKNKSGARITGDLLLYFFIHNIISITFFFLFTVRFEVYQGLNVAIAYIITLDFWSLVVIPVFLFSIISSIIGRILGFLTMKVYFYYCSKKTMKRWSELNKGINRFVISVFLLTAIFTALIYALGLILILQNRIFNQDTLITLIVTYMMVKLGIFFCIRWVLRSQL